VSRAVGGEGQGSTQEKMFMDKTVGDCPFVTVKMGGVSVKSLLDTGSQVSTVTEEFYIKHLKPLGNVYKPTGVSLSLKAANGLDIPYVGYVELDVEVLGRSIPGRGVLVLKEITDPHTQERRRVAPGLLGMNILKSCPGVVGPSPNASEQSEEATAEVKQVQVAKKLSGFVKVAGRRDIRLPAWSMKVVAVTAPLKNGGVSYPALVEGLKTSLPAEALVINTQSRVTNGQLLVRVINCSQLDIWLTGSGSCRGELVRVGVLPSV